MTSKGSQLLCQITSPLGGWWGREPSLGRVRLTLWSAGAGGAARDMWRNWSWCSFVCCLLPPATLLVASCPRRRTMGPPSSAFSRPALLTTVQRRRRRTARWRESTTHPYCGAAVHPSGALGTFLAIFLLNKTATDWASLQFGKKDGCLVKLPAGEWAVRNAPGA